MPQADVQDVRVFGMGAVSAYGRGVEALWAGLMDGRSAISALSDVVTSDLAEPLMGALVPRGPGQKSREGDELGWTVAAAREAWAQCRFDQAPRPERVAVVIGTTLGPETGANVARALDLRGPVLSISTACSTSTHALALARDLILEGDTDAVVVGGVDRLSPEVLAGFSALGVLHEEGCTPFSGPSGTSLGEGAGILVLGRATLGAGTGVALLGTGLTGDGYHETTPHPMGKGTRRAMQEALREASVPPGAIDYVSAHGTGTAANDASEARAFRDVFGRDVNFGSLKGHFGHTLAAAGALEALATATAMLRGHQPPSASETHEPRLDCVAHPALGPARRARTRLAISVNSAFGGVNAAIVLGFGSGRKSPPSPRLRKISFVGTGAVGHAPWPTLIPSQDAPLSNVAPTADPRELDRGSTFVVQAAALALREAKVRMAGPLREATGAVLGVRSASPDSRAAFLRSLQERGPGGASASAFARIVTHASVGALSRTFSVLGPLNTIVGGALSPVAAVIQASRLLRRRPALELMMAGAFEATWPVPLGKSPNPPEGAALHILRAGPGAVELAGEALAGDLETAVETTLSNADCPSDEVDIAFGDPGLRQRFRGRAVEPPAGYEHAPALTMAYVLGEALRQVRKEGGYALVAAASPHAGAAILLRGEPR